MVGTELLDDDVNASADGDEYVGNEQLLFVSCCMACLVFCIQIYYVMLGL